MLRKNTASQFVHIAGINVSTGAIVTGATWTMRRCLDGTFAAGGATVTEDGATGFYKVALTQADTNGNDIGYFFTATSCVPVPLNVVTTACDPTSAAFGLSLAKTTNITGFNDIAAPTGFAAATFPTGTVANTTNITAGTITTVGTLTTYTGNTPQTGDNFARLGAPAGASVSADVAAIQAKTTNLPAAPASTTNITAGTITTATNLTNAPTAGDFTATMKTSIGTAVAASAVASVTGNVGGNVTGSIGSLAAQAKTDVKTQAVDALATDTYAEPGQGNPAATTTLAAKINYLFKAWRNKTTQTATTYNLFADDATTVDQKSTVSDDATTFTRGEIATGP